MIKKKILITSGGTGGHIFPAIALSEKLKRAGFDVYYCFDRRSASYVDLKAKNTFVVNISNKKGSGITQKLKYLINIMMSVLEARTILKKVKPDVIVGFGGYTTFPILFAASAVSSAKLIVHESNSVIGSVNKLFLSKVSAIAGGLASIEDIPNKYLNKFVYTGTPVREMIEQVKRKKHGSKIVILIFGGSQAAKKFSEIIPAAILKLDEKIKKIIHVIQQVKPEDIELTEEQYQKNKISCEIASFFTDIDQKYANANLVIARSGASTISELIKLKMPSILIPLPSSAKGHQLKNALYLASKGAAEVIEEKDISDQKLASTISKIIEHQSKYVANFAKLDIDANQKMLELIKMVVAERV
jgi:UDP-N-acetylglucosamine--N-acetylmuramyl-(pentapeptide) pyrophosphoryl-undecaprenol N-acetylglucosamine transferase